MKNKYSVLTILATLISGSAVAATQGTKQLVEVHQVLLTLCLK